VSKSARLAGLVLAAVALAAVSGRPAPAAERARPIAVAALPDAHAPDAALLARVPWRPPGAEAPRGHLARSETPARRLGGRIDLTFVPPAAPGSRLALHAETAREDAAGTVARHAAVRLNLAYRGSLFDRPGSATLSLGGRAERTGGDRSRAQDLSLRLGLGTARGRLELAAGLGYLEDDAAEGEGQLRSDLSAHLTTRRGDAFELGLEAGIAAAATAPEGRARLQGRLRF